MARVLGPGEGEQVAWGGFGARFMIDSDDAGGGFSLVEHPIAPRTLAAPLHRHANEDEYSYVLEGRMGAQLGDDLVEAGPGDLVFKPRNQWHSFWNPGDEPTRVLELISPGGFERYFAEIAPLLPPNRPEPDFGKLAEIQAKYGLEMDVESIGPLCERHGLRF
jgi:mannose-6-phosphate isomerase-like protein (cupin superfamily)